MARFRLAGAIAAALVASMVLRRLLALPPGWFKLFAFLYFGLMTAYGLYLWWKITKTQGGTKG